MVKVEGTELKEDTNLQDPKELSHSKAKSFGTCISPIYTIMRYVWHVFEALRFAIYDWAFFLDLLYTYLTH